MHLSPDGSQASVVVTDSREAANVWLFDVARGVRTPLTVSGFVSWSAGSIWSPDGRRVVFASTQKGHVICIKRRPAGQAPRTCCSRMMSTSVRRVGPPTAGSCFT